MVATNATKHSAKIAKVVRLKMWFRVIFAPFSSRAASCEPDLGGDRGRVQLTTEQIEGAGVSTDSHSNLHGNVLLYDDIAELAEEVEEPRDAPVMPVMPVMPSTHGVEFRIDQFTHFTHNSLLGVACEQTSWLK